MILNRITANCWKLLQLAIVFLAAFGFQSCKTDDILPIAEISSDSLNGNRIGEGKTFLIRAKLNGPLSADLQIQVQISGSAIAGEDFQLLDPSLIIAAGKDSGSIRIRILTDGKVEGDETINLAFSAAGKLEGVYPSNFTVLISDIDSDQDHDNIPDANDLCPLDSGDASNGGCPPGVGLIFNEVLYDPSNTALDGDANGDGVYSQELDSFVEILNNSQAPADISGYSIWDADSTGANGTSRFTFPAGTILQAKKCAVVFGGGTPTGNFGGAGIFVAQNGTSGLSLNNTLETILLKDKDGKTIASFGSYLLSGNPNESYTRNPDFTGGFVQHAGANPGKLFSPGAKINGDSF